MSVRTKLPHDLKLAWFSSTVPPKIQKPLSVATRRPGTDANGAKSHSENSWRQKRSFTARRPDPKMGHDSTSVVQSPDRNPAKHSILVPYLLQSRLSVNFATTVWSVKGLR